MGHQGELSGPPWGAHIPDVCTKRGPQGPWGTMGSHGPWLARWALWGQNRMETQHSGTAFLSCCGWDPLEICAANEYACWGGHTNSDPTGVHPHTQDCSPPAGGNHIHRGCIAEIRSGLRAPSSRSCIKSMRLCKCYVIILCAIGSVFLLAKLLSSRIV